MTDTHKQIEEIIKNNEVVLFLKGTADTPMCGFSSTVVQILNQLKIPFKDVNIMVDPFLRQAIKDYTNWPTIPQLYVKGEFIGGSDIMDEMGANGELKTLLDEAGATS